MAVELTATGPENGVMSGASGPVRIQRTDVDWPSDGSNYARDVRRLFPDKLADRILDNDEELRPDRRVARHQQ